MFKGFTFIVLLFGFLTKTYSQDWKLAKSQDGIDVYTKKFENSPFKAFKAITTFESSVEEIEKVLLDFEDFPSWVFKCYKSEIVKKINSNEYLVHQFMETPWPVTDRDMVLNYKLTKSDDKSVINIISKSESLKEEEDCIRINIAEGKWELERVDNNKTKIVYQFMADPNGSLPSFLVNMFLVDGPIDTFNNLKEKL